MSKIANHHCIIIVYSCLDGITTDGPISSGICVSYKKKVSTLARILMQCNHIACSLKIQRNIKIYVRKKNKPEFVRDEQKFTNNYLKYMAFLKIIAIHAYSISTY